MLSFRGPTVILLLFACALTAETRLFADDILEAQLGQIEEFVSTNCLDCHSTGDAKGNLDLEAFDFSKSQFSQIHFQSDRWEKILHRLDTRQMPPPEVYRPTENEYRTISNALSKILETRAEKFPRPGRIGTIRRMTRAEYRNAIRDLLAIEIDAESYLSQDESSHGFDNITVEDLSPTHLNRYLSAAQKISRAAIGGLGNGPTGVTIRLPADRSQEDHVPGLPIGTRGGTLFDHHFPQTGEYGIELKLTRDRDEKVEGLERTHHLDVLIDRVRMHRFKVEPPTGEGAWERRDVTHSDSHLKTRINVTAGQHSVGITFPKTFSSLTEGKRQPFDANFNRHRHPRLTPAIYQVSIVGPFASSGPGETASRQIIFGESGLKTNPTRTDAQQLLKRLTRRAYRRPVAVDDLQSLMKFFDEGYAHATSNSAFQSAAGAKRTESSDYYNGITVDQIAAKRIGSRSELPSLELSMDLLSTVGQCDNGYACVYQNNLSWASPTQPLPSEAHPRIVFESLFGEDGTPQQRQDALKKRASLLDLVTLEIKRIKNRGG